MERRSNIPTGDVERARIDFENAGKKIATYFGKFPSGARKLFGIPDVSAYNLIGYFDNAALEFEKVVLLVESMERVKELSLTTFSSLSDRNILSHISSITGNFNEHEIQLYRLSSIKNLSMKSESGFSEMRGYIDNKEGSR